MIIKKIGIENGGCMLTIFQIQAAVDPLAEKYYFILPYAYCAENPINNYQYILISFENRNTNTSDESFNGKNNTFRSQFKGVRDIPFFLFRLSKYMLNLYSPQLLDLIPFYFLQ